MAFLTLFDSNQGIPGKANAFEMCRVLHTDVGFKPSFEFFEKLIAFACDSQDDRHYSQDDHPKVYNIICFL